MNITLKKLIITRFKGLRNFTSDFLHETNIYGENATGKTSVFDAVLWLLFDKNSANKSDFNAKPIDSNGNFIQKTDVEVEAIFVVDGNTVTAKKVLSEKWTTKKGEATPVFTGNEKSYFWNEVPIKAGDFEKKVSGLVDESVFRLVTNTLYFNNALKWQDRRTVLETLAGNISDSEVFTLYPEFSELMRELSGKTFAEYRAQISSSKKKLKIELESIPTRIEEVNRAIANITVQDYDNLRAEIASLETEQTTIDNTLMNAVNANKERNNAIRQKQDEIHRLQTRINQLTFDVKSRATKLMQDEQAELNTVNFNIDKNRTEHANNLQAYLEAEQKLAALKTSMSALREEWNKRNAEVFEFTEQFVFDEHQANCPTCKQKLPADTVEHKMSELRQSFENNKTNKQNLFNDVKKHDLTAINNRGAKMKQDYTSLETKMVEWKNRNVAIDADMIILDEQLALRKSAISNLKNPTQEDIEKSLSEVPEYVAAKNKIAVLDKELEAPAPNQENDAPLRERKTVLYNSINDLRTQLNDEKQLQNHNTRKEQLEADMKKYAQQVADLEKSEFTMLNFEKAKMDMLDRRINVMFSYVTFKLFQTNINGGIEPCCETLIDGVPFSDANTASKIKAGLDIINALCNYHNVWAPIFIDNREGVTEILPTKSQVINLYKVEGALLSVGEVKLSKAYQEKIASRQMEEVS